MHMMRVLHRRVSLALLVPQSVLAGVVGYLLVLTGVAWWRNRRPARAARTSAGGASAHRFSILVPAHDEERLIASTVASMRALDYPKDRYAIHVVADNCTDATAAVASAAGAEVHERCSPDNPGKGPALNWLLRRLRERGERHDAVVVVDADSTLSADFLRVMDEHLTRGDRVVQAYYATRDPGSAPAVGLRYAALAMRHYVRPLGRTGIGGSCGLYGNGMVFAADLLEQRAWSAHLTEDIELQLELLLDGQTVAFAPDAIVEAEMPATAAAARSQNERWERGRIELARRFVPRLLRGSGLRRRGQRVAELDAAVDQLVPPFAVLAASSAAATAASVALCAVRRSSPLARVNVVLAVATVAGQFVHLLAALRMVRAPRTVYRCLLRAPGYVLWKLGLLIRVVSRPNEVAWVRTTRNSEALPLAEEVA